MNCKVIARALGLYVFAFIGFVVADTVTVDWTMDKKAIDPLSFGMDAPFAVTEYQSENADYVNAMRYMTGTSKGNSALLRLHQWGMLSSWTSNGWWDAGKVMRTVRSLKSNGFTININIPDGPGGGFSTIDTNRIGQFCSDLVKIVNVDNKMKVKYWEVPNERDTNAFVGMLSAVPLADLVKRCRAAMKKVDSTILVGGPAFGDAPNLDLILKFVRAVVPDIDFISFHAYSVGGAQNASDSAIYNGTQTKIAHIVKTLRDTLSVLSPNKYIPIHCNEYSFTWDWNYIDSRVHTNKMAVFVALVMIEMVRNGGDITNIWNEKEAAFGMMSSANVPYLPGHLFHLMNTYFMGEMVATTETDRSCVVAFASRDSATYSLALINRSQNRQDVTLGLKGLPASLSMKRYEIWTAIDSSKTITIADLSKGISLPDNSVTILTAKGAPLSVNSRHRTSSGIAMKSGPIRVSVYTVSGRLIGSFFTTERERAAARFSETIRSGLAKVIDSGVYVISIKDGSLAHVQRRSLEF